MKLFSLLSLAMILAVSSVAATFPAATNNPNVFYKSNTFLDLSKFNGSSVFGGSVSLGAGATTAAAVTTTSPTTNAPANDEFASAGWIRGLFNNIGAPYYNTTNLASFGTNTGSDQPLYLFAINAIPPTQNRTYTTANFLTNNGYVGSVVTTNTFLQFGGSIEVNAYLGFTGGGGGPTLTMHPEIYYSYDRTNWAGDYASANQNIVNGISNLYQFVISVPTIVSTNSNGFYVQRRLKVGTITGTGVRTLTVLVGTNAISGTNDAGHVDLQLPDSNQGNAFLAANQTFTGVNTFTKNLLAATNAQTLAVDMNIGYGDYQTAAAFSFSGLLNKSTTTYQSSVITVTNSTGAVVGIGAPANTHTNGVMAYNVTNISKVLMEWNPRYNYTNMLVFPLF